MDGDVGKSISNICIPVSFRLIIGGGYVPTNRPVALSSTEIENVLRLAGDRAAEERILAS